MSDDFTKNRLAWLEQVAVDRDLAPQAARIAIILATRYLNRETQTAWPSRETMAEDLGVTVKAVARGLVSLETGGHLAVEHGRGRGRSNVYRLALKGDAGVPINDKKRGRERPLFEEEKGSFASVKGDVSVPKRGHFCPEKGSQTTPKPYEEPYEEPYDGTHYDAVASEIDLPFRVASDVETFPEALFDLFWDTYPRPIDRRETLKAWLAAIEAGSDPRQICVAAKAYATARAGKDPKYTKASRNWLQAEAWLDPALPDPLAQEIDPLIARLGAAP